MRVVPLVGLTAEALSRAVKGATNIRIAAYVNFMIVTRDERHQSTLNIA